MPSRSAPRPVLRRFGPTLRGSRLTELGRLAFTTTVQDFADRFQRSRAMPRASPRQRADLCVDGLPDYIRVDVEMRERTCRRPCTTHGPTSSAPSPCSRSRATWQRSSRAPNRPTPPPAGRCARGPPAPTRPSSDGCEQLERRRRGCASTATSVRAGPHVRPPLLPGDRRRRRRGGPHRRARGRHRQAGVTTYAPVDASTFVVSLHAMAGIKTAKTMLLPVMINGERLTALVDTGSTHNFLSNTAMRRHALQPAGSEKYSVTVANGDRLACQGVARQVPVLVGDEPFYRLRRHRLGLLRLHPRPRLPSTLGPILWDLDVLSLIFWREGGRRVGSTGVAQQSSG
ncbi:hypothetical protein QYE76_026970 [Lolium multiflorum]|uniref:Uncharacterized protein n=1 Tax=Lolium multiflorum TaxID=4521 RepID=A0AAD8QHG1_LOLMU|nr:hypothetical protein QYE76_026970 [Lolium multiflorum]